MASKQENVPTTLRFSDGREKPRVIEVFGQKDAIVSSVPVDEPLFAPSPSSIVIDQYEPLQTYEIVLRFRNKDKAARRLRVMPSTVPWLVIEPKDPSRASQKVASGMDVLYVLRLAFPQRRVHRCFIECMSERERFLVAVESVGPRPNLEFPKCISFQDAPLNISSSKTIYVRNTGDGSAHFFADCAKPFSVFPLEGYVDPDGGIQLEILFSPSSIQTFSDNLIIRYDDCESSVVQLSGNAVALPVTLSSQSVDMGHTFVGLLCKKQLRISNPSSYKVRFAFKRFSTEVEDIQHDMRKDILAIDQSALAGFQASSGADPYCRNLFSDDLFSIVPLHGEVWPGSTFDVEIHFLPRSAASFSRTVFLQLAGKPNRLPISLAGRGVGPKLNFTYDSLAVGQMFISKPYSFLFVLENQGSIDARFELVANRSLFGSKFRFSPDNGVLAGGEQVTINVSFLSDVLGEFSETFEWRVDGAADPLVVHIDGVCVGPTFEFDRQMLDFGEASLSFLVSRQIFLTNTSEISMTANFRIPEDDGQLRKEFDIVPRSLFLEPEACGRIQIDFIPSSKKKYEANLVLDIENVGSEVYTIPINALCIVPSITVAKEMLSLNECFINFEYCQVVNVLNGSHLPAKYELSLPRMDQEKPLLTLNVDRSSGIIPAHGSLDAEIRFSPRVLGDLNVPVYFAVPGGDESPKTVTLKMKVIGPIVEPKEDSLDFGKTPVLQDHVRMVTLCNKSPIAAMVNVALLAKNSAFSVAVTEFTIPPNSEYHVEVLVHPNETMVFRDELEVSVQYAKTFVVKLSAQGTGTCLVTTLPGNVARFGSQFTNRPIEMVFGIENRGRRAQVVSFAGLARTSSKVFSVEPEHQAISPGSQAHFVLRAMARKAGGVKDVLTVRTERDRKFKDVLDIEAVAEFVNPLLQFSQTDIRFVYVYCPDSSPVVQSTILTAKNVGVLPLRFSLDAQPPFSLSSSSFDVQPNESVSCVVEFDPVYRADKVSHDVDTKLIVSYLNHPQKDVIPLTAHIVFPNLSFDKKDLKFGCILAETEKRLQLQVSNTSQVDASFSWRIDLLDDVGDGESTVIDVLPIRSTLKPSESETVEFVYYGADGRALNALAVCCVEGGPDYEVPLSGDSSVVMFKLEKNVLDFGDVVFNRAEERDIVVINTGKVAFPYTFDLSKCARPGVIELTSLSGKIAPGERVRVACRFVAGYPRMIDDMFTFQAGHLDPVPIRVTGTGVFSRAILSIPRCVNCLFDDCLAVVRQKVANGELAVRSDTLHRDLPRTPSGSRPLSGKSFTLTARDFELEVEAEREFLCQRLDELYFDVLDRCLKKFKSRSVAEIYESVSMMRDLVSSQLSAINGLQLSAYRIDFGSVIRGMVVDQGFRLWNSGNSPLSFAVDHKAFANSGFSLEPEKIAKLPEGLHQDMHVTANTKLMQEGMNRLLIPFRVRSGLPVIVEMGVNVVVPVLDVSTDKLDFGNVFGGECKSALIRLENKKDLSLEWFVKRPDSAFSANFDVVPSKGVVKPHEHVDVEVRFLPTDDRQYVFKLQVVASGEGLSAGAAVSKTVACRGTGIVPRLAMASPALHLGTVLPYSHNVSTLSISNPFDRGMEVFSRNFDEQHVLESDILSAVLSKDSYSLIDLREPGAVLPDELVAQYSRLVASSESPVDDATDPSKAEADRTAYIRSESLNIVVHGARWSGRSTLSNRLSAMFRLPVVSFDAAIESVFYSEGAASDELRAHFVHTSSGSEPQLSPTNLPVSLMCAVLRQFLSAGDFDKGFILDGLSTVYSKSFKDALQAVCDACFNCRSLSVISLSLSYRIGQLRRLGATRDVLLKDLEGTKVKYVTDDEYDRLSEEQKAAYDDLLAKIRSIRMQLKDVASQIELWTRKVAEEAEEVWTAPIDQPIPPPEPVAPKAKTGNKKDVAAAPVELPPTPPHPAKKMGDEFASYVAFDEEFKDVRSVFDKFMASESQSRWLDIVAARSPQEVCDDVTSRIPVKTFVETDDASILNRTIVKNVVRISTLKKASIAVRDFSIEGSEISASRPVSRSGLSENVNQYVGTQSCQAGLPGGDNCLFTNLMQNRKSCRWVIPAKSSLRLSVRFSPTTPGHYSSSLTFGIVGWHEEFAVQCSGTCDYARINDEPRNLFFKVVKPKVAHDPKCVMAYDLLEKQFDFGPLLIGRKLDSLSPADADLFRTRLRLTNVGHTTALCTMAFAQSSGSPFCVTPAGFELACDETKEIVVSCCPASAGRFEDNLFLCIQNNPEPVRLKFVALGAAPEMEISVPEIDFGRMLKGTAEEREFVVYNRSLLPVKWKLHNMESLGSSFSAAPKMGTISPMGSSNVNLRFSASDTKATAGKIEVLVFDQYSDHLAQGIKEWVKKEIVVKAESYEVDVECELPKEGLFDFGVVKVGHEYEKTLVMCNKNAKYDVSFRFSVNKRSLERLVRIDPSNGVLKAGGKDKQTVRIFFKADSELSISSLREIHCHYSDPGTSENVGKFSLALSARAVFSKFTLIPAFGLNFGPMLCDASKSRKFEVRNDGDFPFDFAVTANPSSEFPVQAASGSSTAPSGKDAKKGSAAASTGTTSIAIGPFTVSPSVITVSPGATESVSVTFMSKEPGIFNPNVFAHVRDRDPRMFPEGVAYAMEAEACVPGISTEDFVSVFEEQQVMQSMQSAANVKDVFVSDLRLFTFGTVLVGDEVTQRFKISNPHKVAVDVQLEMAPLVDGAKDAFALDTSFCPIPSHESRYIGVTFKPGKLGTFSATFRAVPKLQSGTPKELKFEVRGEATLPHVSIEKPDMKPGGAVLDFGKVLVNREQKQSVRLKNHGSVDATVQVVVDGQGFDLLGPSSFILHPSEQRTLDVGFRLSKEGQFEGSLKVQVLRNSFEENSVKLKAVCFHQNLVPENLPGDRNDAIVLSECAIGTVKTFDFALRNMSTDMLRVQLSLLKAEGLKCSPSVCHIPPNSSKVVLLSWTPESSVNMTSVQSAFSASYRRVKMVTSASALPEDAAGEWDDRQVVVQWIRENGRPVKKVTPVPEPVVENVDTAAMDFTLPIHGVSDVASCEVSVVDIAFESTLLFGSRSKQVSVKNNGKIAIHGRAYMEFADVQMDPNTFGVTPSQFTVEPEKLLEFTVTYRPLDMLPHEGCLVFSVPGLDKQELGCRKVVLRGVASCPLVHFEVPFSSDYISSRRPAGLPGPDGIIGPLNPETRVIEIESRGVKVRNTRKFYILNPTSMSYDFRLVASALNSRSAAVRCLTTSGVVHSGKKYELVFEFVPDTLTVQEAFFTFEIVGRNYSVPFLVVGKAAEPEVLFEKGSVHFRPLLVGRKATEIVQLVNREHLPFAFAFEGLDSSKSITVAPASGLVPPESQQSIEVTFAPDVEDSYNVNLSCFVKKKPSALNLNIKGDAYMVKDSLMMVDVDGSVSEIYPSTANSVDLGRIYVGQRLERQFRIVNSGRHPFDYSWGGSSSRHLTIAPAEGTVAKGESKNITVAFHPSVETRLDHLKTVCKVANGHQFVVELNAVAARPALRFSFFAFDFGQCFVYHPASQASSVDLLVQNDDMVDISFDVLFENLPHLEVKASPTVLKPGHSQVITISFFPREARSYHEVIPIEINGLTTVNIAIDGEGTLPRLELVNPAQQSVAFGSVRVGESVTKTISIVNKSRIASRLLLEDASLKDSYISIAPREVLLRPQQVLDLTVCFAPLSRLRAFKNVSVPLTVGGIPFSLFSLSGVAQGLEVKLDPSILSFGAVVENAAAVQKVIVENSGDVGFAYRFIHTEGTREFLVNPSEGFVAAHTDGVVEVSFSPLPLTTGSPEERTAKFVFAIEGGSPPSTLCCSGTCVARPPAQETVKFATSVRSTASKKVTIKNPTKMDWLLRPIIDHDFWKGSSPTLQVAANSSGTYELNFLPLTMTSQQSGPHKGSMFVPCPDGSALLFLLEGEASAPVPENNGASGPVTVPAKSLYVHSLTVKNWLKTPQRFQVLMELQKHDTTTVKGLDYIDVPGSLSRDYKLTIYPYVESSTTGKITFRNIETQEYAFFNINFVHSAPRPLANIALEAHVRQSAFYTIRIDNPLTEDVTLSCSCSSMSLSLPSQSVIAKGMQESAFVVTYFPLVAGTEKDVKFELKSDKLGSFPYLFTLNAHAASSERSYHFEVPLGSSSSQTIRFISYVKQAVDYAVELTGDGGDFETSAKTVKANAAVSGSREGVEVSFPVMFTPRMLGASRSNVRVFHATGGEYLFTLTGSCVPPRPQGPFEIKANQSISIPFTNVFRDNAVFNIVVDNSAFVVKPSETVPAGKAIQIAVQFKPLGAVTAPVVSKLVVTNDRSPPWVFYLKGTN